MTEGLGHEADNEEIPRLEKARKNQDGFNASHDSQLGSGEINNSP
jgi:hypothetical protein